MCPIHQTVTADTPAWGDVDDFIFAEEEYRISER